MDFFYLLTKFKLSKTFFVKKLLEEIELCVEVDEVGNQTEVKKSLLSAPQYEALKWTIALFVCELFRAMSFSIMFAITIRTSARVVNALNGMIFDKILHRPPTEPDTTCIQPSNLFANDLWKVFQMFYMAPLVIGSPIIILVTIFYTIYLIGYSAIFGLILFVQMFILQIFITKKQTNLRGRIMKQTDHRISLIAQFMKFARAIKFNAWESAFHKDIDCNDFQRFKKIFLNLNFAFARLPPSGNLHHSSLSISTMSEHFVGIIGSDVDYNHQHLGSYLTEA